MRHISKLNLMLAWFLRYTFRVHFVCAMCRYISQPDSGEEALEISDMLVKSGAVDVIVVDSVAALVPQAELDGEMR